MLNSVQIELGGSRETGPCKCCGHLSRVVWGFARWEGLPVATYSVHWTIGHVPEHGANFDLIVGAFGEGTHTGDRFAVSLFFRLSDDGHGFMVLDAAEREVARSKLAGHALNRNDVIGQPISQDVFALCDAIMEQDDRLVELQNGSLPRFVS